LDFAPDLVLSPWLVGLSIPAVSYLCCLLLSDIEYMPFSCLLFLAITCKHVIIHTHTHTHTHTRLTALFSGTTQVSRYLKGKTNLDFTEARDSEWQWHQLGHMQVCTLL